MVDRKLLSPLQYRFKIGPRYTDLKPLGFGGNGLVCSAVDSECDKHVAVKRIAFSDRRSCRLALREIKIIRRLQHDNIVRLYEILGTHGDIIDLYTVPNINEFRIVYLVQELLDTDLHKVIQSQTLSSEHIRLFMYQLLRALKYIHSANVLHRDLKPSNLLINLEDMTLKIGDFGLARIIDPTYSHKGFLSENISTRWYRSPELMLTPNDYTKAIDMWSCGCILAEMLLGKPIFPGANEAEQMTLVIEAISVHEDNIEKVLNTVPKNVLKNYHGQPKWPLRERFPNIDRDALYLLECFLTFDPVDRITTDEALMHPYLHMYSYSSDEPITNKPFRIENEVDDLSPTTLKQIIFTESFPTKQYCDNAENMDNLSTLEDLSINDFPDNSESDIKEEDFLNRSFTEVDMMNYSFDNEKLLSPAQLQEEFNSKIQNENISFEKKLALDCESECSEKSDEDVKDTASEDNNSLKDELELEEKLAMEVAEKEKMVLEETTVEKKHKCKLNVASIGKSLDNISVEENSEKVESENSGKEDEENYAEMPNKTIRKKEIERETKKDMGKSEDVNHGGKSVKRKVKMNCNHKNGKEEHEKEKTLQHCLEIDKLRKEEIYHYVDHNCLDLKNKSRIRHKSTENLKHGEEKGVGYTSPKVQHRMNEKLKLEQEKNVAMRLNLLGMQKGGLDDFKQQLHIELPVLESTDSNSPRSPKTNSPRGEKSVRPKKYNTKPKGK
ncbi:uncharacterized protein LOC102803083 [Saccoglossus kowalevskii]|uniref:Mitogen-activated protein kinase 6-like n=1 Tax=Saccoglossus kowalevskii TaxID=10224 RepID=A0ABM0LXE1_SACKO|nr:PREDICTED: mitogen-activated protein kinase 6-like [Saccoglossus kowalevskii]